MRSQYLNELSPEERSNLITRLHQTQDGKCFICEKPVDLELQTFDVDHVESISANGADTPRNFAITHDTCNRSKLASDLRVARILSRFNNLTQSLDRSPNLDDVLSVNGGGKFDLKFRIENSRLTTTFSEIGSNDLIDVPVYVDFLSKFKYVFLEIPIEYLHHDDRINPRSIGKNLRGLVEEFYKKYPQLHVSLGWMDSQEGKVRVFDGQHKAAAQILLGTRSLPIRIFVDPDKDALLTANTHAGTNLKQVAFDKSIQRNLGSSLLTDRINRYILDKDLENDNTEFSEKDLCDHFRGERREMQRYVLDGVRTRINTHEDNQLRKYIEYGGRTADMPFSYSTIERTFYSLFISKAMLNTPIGYRLEEGLNPRQLEVEQIVRLMNIIATKIYLNKFESDRKIRQVENDVIKGRDVPLDHLRACRLAREEIAHTWLESVRTIIYNYRVNRGVQPDVSTLFQSQISPECWQNIENFIDSLVSMTLWVNLEFSATVFSGKRNYAYWQAVFTNGSAPDGTVVLGEPINLIEMIQERSN